MNAYGITIYDVAKVCGSNDMNTDCDSIAALAVDVKIPDVKHDHEDLPPARTGAHAAGSKAHGARGKAKRVSRIQSPAPVMCVIPG
jgi:hypothetical protein